MVLCGSSQLLWLAYAALVSDLQRATHVTESQVVWLATVFPLLYVPLSIPVGRIIDRLGYRSAVLAGGVFLTAGAALRLAPGAYLALLAGSVLAALGQPLLLNSVTKLTGSLFAPEEEGRATGLFTLSLFAGMLVAMVGSPLLYQAFGRDKSALAAMGLVYLLLAAGGLVGFLLAGRGLAATGHTGFPVLHIPRALRPGGSLPPAGASTWRVITGLWREPGFVPLTVVMCLGLGALIAFLELIQNALQASGLSDRAAGALGALFVMVAAAGGYLIPALSDRLGHQRRTLAASTGAAGVGLALAGLTGTRALAVVGGTVAAAALAALWSLVLTESVPIAGPERSGMAASVLLMAGNLTGVVFTLGLVRIEQWSGYTAAFALLGLVTAIGVVPALRLPRSAARTGAPPG
jgi:MFS family permease